MTGLMVEREAEGLGFLAAISSKTGVNLVAVLSCSSSRREVGGEVLEENRLDEGERGDPYVSKEVSASDVVVDVDARFDLRGCKGLGTNASCLVGFAEALLVFSSESETRTPLSSCCA